MTTQGLQSDLAVAKKARILAEKATAQARAECETDRQLLKVARNTEDALHAELSAVRASMTADVARAQEDTSAKLERYREQAARAVASLAQAEKDTSAKL